MANFQRVLEDVFAVAVSEFQPAQQPDKLRVQPADAGGEHRFLARRADGFRHFLLSAVHHVLDARGVYPAVRDEFRHGDSGGLPPYRVEAGQGHGFGGVVYYQVDSGAFFDCPYIPSFSAYQATFHVVIGKGDCGDGQLGHGFGRHALDGGGEDLGRHFARVFAVALLNVAVAARDFVPHLFFRLAHDDAPRFRKTELGDFLELGDGLLAQVFQPVLYALSAALGFGYLAFAPVEIAGALFQIFLSPSEPLFRLGQFRAPVSKLILPFRAQSYRLFLRLDYDGAPLVASRFHNARRLLASAGYSSAESQPAYVQGGPSPH